MGRPDIVVLALLCILSTSLAHRRDSAAPSCAPIATENGPGTTLGLEATYKGLCYKSVKSTLCDASWTSFEQIVLSKGPSDFNWRDFESLFRVLNTSSRANTVVFWAGDGILAHRLTASNSNYMTLEDTFPASSLDSLSFCPTDLESANDRFFDFAVNRKNQRSSSQSGNVKDLKEIEQRRGVTNTAGRSFNTTQCVRYASQNLLSSKLSRDASKSSYSRVGISYEFKDAFGAFWQAASIRWAREAVGKAHIVLEVPDSGPTFCQEDFFGSIELPTLSTSAVTQFHVMIASNKLNPVEKCGSGSFVQLERAVISHFSGVPNFLFICSDDPYDLTLVRCAGKGRLNSDCQSLLAGLHLDGKPAAPQSIGCANGCVSKKIYTFLMIGVSIGTFAIGFLLAASAPMFTACAKRTPLGSFLSSSSRQYESEETRTALLEDESLLQ